MTDDIGTLSDILDEVRNNIIESGEMSDDDWELQPPTFDEYSYSGNYITPVKYSPKQYQAVVSVLGTDPKKIFSPERVVSLGVLCVGKGGGKDWLVAKVLSYVITVLLHLKNPQKFLGIDGALDVINVATKGKQAEGVFFKYLKDNIKNNKFMLDRYIIYDETKLFNRPTNNKGIIKLGSNMAIFPNSIRCLAETSKNETWEGYNVIFFVLDEISGFVSEKQNENGWKIYETADTSCISRRTKKFKGLGFIISYPRKEKNDIILDLLKMSRDPKNKHMFGMFAFSWQFKLNDNYSGETFTFVSPRFNRFINKEDLDPIGIEIPIEYKEKFDTNPELSLLYFCCLPPRASGDWIEYPERVLACIDHLAVPMFVTQDYVDVVKQEDGDEYRMLAKKIIRCNENDLDKRQELHVAWLDNAEKSCDAVIAIARKEKKVVKDVDGYDRVTDVCKIVDIINWIPDKENSIIVDLVNVEDFLVLELKKFINLRAVGADYWNSSTLMNRLRRAGIKTYQINLLGNEYETAKELFYKGQVSIFDEEDYLEKSKKDLSSIDQMLALVAGIRHPEKKEGLKKDKSDAVVGCINMILGNFTNDKKKTIAQKNDGMPSPIFSKSNNSNIFSKNPMGDLSESQSIFSSDKIDINSNINQREKNSSLPKIIKGR